MTPVDKSREDTGDGLAGRSDDELMTDVGAGDHAAFGELVSRHHGRLWKIAWRFAGDEQSARDLVQDAFVQVLRSAPGYRGEGKFRSYSHRILVNLAMNRQRHDRWLRFFPAVDEAPAHQRIDHNTPETLVAQKEARTRLDEALATIPPRQRMAVLLRYDGEMSHDEIADAMKVSPKTAERLLARGREALRAILRA